tara:strand:- start:707 stop:1180 length:474 start_codon:yes stop_codon:yes gene_type:complete
MASKSEDDKIFLRIKSKALAVVEEYRQKCANDMRTRLLLNQRSNDGDPQRPLTYKGRKYPELPILIQEGNLKDSINVRFTENFVKKSFFVASGSDLARQHNDGYTYTMRNGQKNEVPPRPCLEIPEQYRLGGVQLNFMRDDILKVVNDEIKVIATER